MTVKKKRFDKKLLFYAGLLALPLLQFAIFYVYVNFNSFVLATKKYDVVGLNFKFVGLENFKTVVDNIFVTDKVAFGIRFRNSFFDYCMTLVVGMVGAIVFSYYIYKQQFLSGAFKIILFLPHIIPSVALISIFKYFIDAGGVNFVNNVLHLEHLEITTFLRDQRFNYATILSFSLFISFGTQVLMYLGAMNKINPSITEAAELDGITFFKELWYITLPNIFSTIATFLVVGLSVFFKADMGVYTMFGTNASNNIQTIGYYLNRLIIGASANQAQWGYISAFGLCCTFIVAPLTYFLKQYLDKADPLV